MPPPYTTNPIRYKRILLIGAIMIDEGVDEILVKDAVKMALDYEGTFDLMVLWAQEPEYRIDALNAIKEEVGARWQD